MVQMHSLGICNDEIMISVKEITENASFDEDSSLFIQFQFEFYVLNVRVFETQPLSSLALYQLNKSTLTAVRCVHLIALACDRDCDVSLLFCLQPMSSFH